MSHELSASMPRQEGEGANGGGVNLVSLRPQDLQNVKLVVDVGGGKTLVIPLSAGHLILNSCGSPSQGAACKALTTAEEIKAVAEEPQDAEATKKSDKTIEKDKQDACTERYLDAMRGWLMTAAAILINMSFSAMLHPPEWMKITEFHMPRPTFRRASNRADTRISYYLFANVFTFSTALVLVLVLLRESSSAKKTLRVSTGLVYAAAGSLAITCALGSSNDWVVTGYLLGGTVIYAFMAVYYVHIGFMFEKKNKQEQTDKQAHSVTRQV